MDEIAVHDVHRDIGGICKGKEVAPPPQIKEHEWQGKGQERNGEEPRPTPTAPPTPPSSFCVKMNHNSVLFSTSSAHCVWFNVLSQPLHSRVTLGLGQPPRLLPHSTPSRPANAPRLSRSCKRAHAATIDRHVQRGRTIHSTMPSFAPSTAACTDTHAWRQCVLG